MNKNIALNYPYAFPSHLSLHLVIKSGKVMNKFRTCAQIEKKCYSIKTYGKFFHGIPVTKISVCIPRFFH